MALSGTDKYLCFQYLCFLFSGFVNQGLSVRIRPLAFQIPFLIFSMRFCVSFIKSSGLMVPAMLFNQFNFTFRAVNCFDNIIRISFSNLNLNDIIRSYSDIHQVTLPADTGNG